MAVRDWSAGARVTRRGGDAASMWRCHVARRGWPAAVDRSGAVGSRSDGLRGKGGKGRRLTEAAATADGGERWRGSGARACELALRGGAPGSGELARVPELVG